jgi:hypothetical protein
MTHEWTRDELTDLRDVLSDLYPNRQDVRRILWDLGHKDARFDLEGPTSTCWTNVLRVLSQQPGDVDKLLALAAKEYPRNAGVVRFLGLLAAPTSTPAATSTVDFRKLSGAQWRSLQSALVSAFPSYAELERLTQFRLDVALPTIVANGALDHVVFELIRWSQARGCTEKLYRAACEERPGSTDLASFERTVGSSASPSSTG